MLSDIAKALCPITDRIIYTKLQPFLRSSEYDYITTIGHVLTFLLDTFSPSMASLSMSTVGLGMMVSRKGTMGSDVRTRTPAYLRQMGMVGMI